VFDEGVNFNQNTMNVDDKNVENCLNYSKKFSTFLSSTFIVF